MVERVKPVSSRSDSDKEITMDQETQKFVLDIIDHAKDLTLATIRPDGYPQATTVSYCHDGLTIYAVIGLHSQKAENIRQCNKVSMTINAEYSDWNHIKGLSIGAQAEILSNSEEIQHAGDCMLKRFPQAKEWAETEAMKELAFLRIQPQVISVLNYEKGFGHTELVTV
jgi:nitroimidazol reductase NimA-like FMN-containing flavoprotein (pyridoxamine 5'-phosphate oxidase superfamily)